MKAFCSRCKLEYSIDEYEASRFCRECGSRLELISTGDGRISDDDSGNDVFNYNVELATEIGKVLHEQFSTKTEYFEGRAREDYRKTQ